MTIWRRWVVPLLLVVSLGLIAASLTKIAFFPSEDAATTQPHAGINDPVIAVERGDIISEVTLAGTVSRDADVVIRSEIDGVVIAVHATSGQQVEAGQHLFTVRRDEWPAATLEVRTAEAGTLGDVSLVTGQLVSLGGELVTLSPNRYHVLSTVEPVQLYRLLDAPESASASITGGPAPFECTALKTQVSDSGTTSVRCNIPVEQVVFPGLPVSLSIAVGAAEDALMVPVTAVRGGSGSGVVWIDQGEGFEPEQREISLGLSDGLNVQVLSGLNEDELIRQFVPGVEAPLDEFCYEIAPGEEYCESGVNW